MERKKGTEGLNLIPPFFFSIVFTLTPIILAIILEIIRHNFAEVDLIRHKVAHLKRVNELLSTHRFCICMFSDNHNAASCRALVS